MKRLVIINLILIMILYIIPKPIENEQLNTVVNSNEQIITSRNLEIPRIEPQIIIATEISQEGIDFIKSFERIKLRSL